MIIREATLYDVLRNTHYFREWDKKALAAFGGEGTSEMWAARTFLACELLFCAEDGDGNPIGLAGVIQESRGVFSIWATSTIYLTPRIMLRVLTFLEGLINNVFDHFGAHRVECYVLADFVGGHHCVRRLGFQFEGIRRAAGANQEDAFIYSRSRP